MTLYCGIDLHSNNSVVAVLDERDRTVYEKSEQSRTKRTPMSLRKMGVQTFIALPRHRCEPVIFIAFGWFRREVDVVGAVRILLEALGLAADGRELLAGLQLRAGLVVIHRQCPEIFCRRIAGI